jgi:hypothetical protein
VEEMTTPARFILVAVALAALWLPVACRRQEPRRYSRSEIVGDYAFKARDEGLVLRPDGTFEHCWNKRGASSSERGTWEASQVLRGGGAVSLPEVLELVLFHDAGNDTPSGELIPGGNPSGAWMEAIEVEDLGGRPGLTVNDDTPGWYYMKLPAGQRTCPR